MSIRIAIAEDNTFLAKSLKEKLSFFDELKFKFWAIDGNLLLEKLAKDTRVDVVLMDIQMPNKDGIEATYLLKQKYPHIKVIMLTVYDDDIYVFKAIQSGADGYLLKEIDPEALYNAIKQVMQGGAPMTPSIATKTLKLLRNPVIEQSEKTLDVKLSKREVQILEQLSKGLSYDEIAENLCISKGTVRKHVQNIYKKLQVHNKLEAVTVAKKHNLL